jgi:hypothetical protein
VLRFSALLWVFAACAGCGAKTGLDVPPFPERADTGSRDGGMDARVDAAPGDAGDAGDAADAADVGMDGRIVVDAGPDAALRDAAFPDGPPICVPGRFPLALTTAELMLVIDRSGSMRQSIDGDPVPPRAEWRWFVLRDALAGSLTDLDPRIRVGAKFFPDPIPVGTTDPIAACVSSPGVDFAPASGTAPAILARFDDPWPAGGTPTAEALTRAATALTAHRRYLLLATDGAPNCNPDAEPPPPSCICTSTLLACLGTNGVLNCLDERHTVDVITDLASRGIPTFVVGIEDRLRVEFSDTLDAMAVAGGRPRHVPGERQFYSAESPEQLSAAVADITSSIVDCGFFTPSLPSGDEHFRVAIDGVEIPEDDANGWIWTDRFWGELDLAGDACERARAPGAVVEALIDSCDR